MGYQLIETIEVGSGGAASIEFTGIPQDGVDLVVKVSLRGSGASIEPSLNFNSDSGSNYNRIHLRGDGSTASSASASSATSLDLNGFIATSGSTSNTFSNGEILVSNYTSSSNKSVSADGVNENNATTAYAAIVAGSYSTSSPITSLKITKGMVQYSSASLYKITAD